MTKEVAEKIVRGITNKIECNTVDIDDWAEFWGFTREEYEEFLDMAIKALEQEPCEDCISRENTLKAMIEQLGIRNEDYLLPAEATLYNVVKNMPPVTPQQKMGKWINIGSGQECNRCGEIQYGYDSFRRFCSSCGAKMQQESK